MKKLLTLSVMVLALVAFGAMFVNAGEGCTASKDATQAKMTKAGDKASCATKCTAEQMESCAKAMGMTVEECTKAMADGKMAMQTISIEGMTCGSCEESVTTALKGVKGVNHVVSVSYKEGSALVCVDKAACKDDMLIKAVSSKGYKAKMMNAAVKTDEMKAAAGSCSKTCSAAEKAACDAKKKETDKKDKTDGTL